MAMTLITTNSDTTDIGYVEFDGTIDSTYKLYMFKFINLNAATDGAHWVVSAATTAHGGGSWGPTKTSTFFRQYQFENDAAQAFGYLTGYDHAQQSSYQVLGSSNGNDADKNACGTFWLFNPSSTTYVKHFYCTMVNCQDGEVVQNEFSGGYYNTTDAVDSLKFYMSSGNFDGIVSMYGVS